MKLADIQSTSADADTYYPHLCDTLAPKKEISKTFLEFSGLERITRYYISNSYLSFIKK